MSLMECFYVDENPPKGKCPHFNECGVSDPECLGSLCDDCANKCKSTNFVIMICERYKEMV